MIDNDIKSSVFYFNNDMLEFNKNKSSIPILESKITNIVDDLVENKVCMIFLSLIYYFDF